MTQTINDSFSFKYRCNTHGRHSQKQKEKYFTNTRILTHATMGPKRPW